MKARFGWVLASAMLAGGISSAYAADMALKARPPVVPIYSWTGCYVGGNGGGKWANTDGRVTIPATALTPTSVLDFGNSNSDNGTWIAGGQVGCNWQTGKLVLGIEGDADAQHWKRTSI